jgi:isoleucyl-tRNA synthetase
MTAINKYVRVDFSALYMESIKDRIYCDAKDSKQRRSVQTVLYHVFNHLLGMLSPVTPLLVEEVWQYAPNGISAVDTHPLQRLYPVAPPEWRGEDTAAAAAVPVAPLPVAPTATEEGGSGGRSNSSSSSSSSLARDLPWLLQARSAINALLERARERKEVTRARESHLVLAFAAAAADGAPSRAHQLFRRYRADLEDFFITSGIELVSGGEAAAAALSATFASLAPPSSSSSSPSSSLSSSAMPVPLATAAEQTAQAQQDAASDEAAAKGQRYGSALAGLGAQAETEKAAGAAKGQAAAAAAAAAATWLHTGTFASLDGEGVTVYLLPPKLARCDRCWKYHASRANGAAEARPPSPSPESPTSPPIPPSFSSSSSSPSSSPSPSPSSSSSSSSISSPPSPLLCPRCISVVM